MQVPLRECVSAERPRPKSDGGGHADSDRDRRGGTDEAPYQPLLFGLHNVARTRAAAPRLRLHAQTSALIANAHQTCQCDKKPPAIKKALVQPASTPNRH